MTLVVALSAGTTAVALAPAASASTYDFEAQFIAKMNAAREANGQAPYAVASDLTYVARQHSAQMASRQELYHNPSLTTDITNWQAVGENVGEGPTVSDIHTAFMNSPEHRANILDHDFTQVGVGVSVDKNGIIWVTEDFREPMPSSSGGTTTTTHHSSSTTTTHAASSASSWTPSAGTSSAAASAPAPSPRAVLLQRLHQLRTHRRPAAADPVAQSFDYVSTLSALTR